MCGIAGYVDFSSKSPNLSILEAMAKSLGRRGPDEHGVLIDGPCGLAHTRLSIIDVGGSRQPMSTTNRAASIVYNGELYNFEKLRAEARAGGETFGTNGDTEVVLRTIARHGVDGLKSMDGMFAIAFWDSTRQHLTLARDLLGEKPLFYALPAPGMIVFGSEPKALMQHPGVDKSVDQDALRQALRFRAVYGDASLHSGIRQLKPGHYLEFSSEGVRIEPFEDLITNILESRNHERSTSPRQLVDNGLRLFLDSVDERLVGDVPVGAFLSGGLDSSLIVAAMRKLRGPEGISTFSVGFSDDPHSELAFAKVVADALGTEHTPITVGPDSFVNRMVELSFCRDGPVSQPADVAIAEMSHIARKSVKVALSGEGADEVFGGYPKYGFANVPSVARRAISLVGSHRTAALASMIGIDKARTLIAARALSGRGEADRAAQWFSYFDQKELGALLPGLNWTDTNWNKTIEGHVSAAKAASNLDALTRMQAMDCLTWLPGNMLERGDRMTMAEGLEVRPPFLDKDLVAFGLGLPRNLKMQGRVNKWIVRQWAANLLPPEIVNRKKWGFRVPLDIWFRGPMRSILFDYLTSSKGICGSFGDHAAIQALLARHDSSQADESNALWTLLSAEIWYQDVYLPRTSGRSPDIVAASPPRLGAGPGNIEAIAPQA